MHDYAWPPNYCSHIELILNKFFSTHSFHSLIVCIHVINIIYINLLKCCPAEEKHLQSSESTELVKLSITWTPSV